MIKFQYVSDLHLEHYTNLDNINFKKLNDCDNLFLLGDIGYAYTDIYHDFIKYCSETWKNVFVIYGNHEYQCRQNIIKTMTEINNETLKFPKNVYFLNNESIFINKNDKTVKKILDINDGINDYIKIIGSILWSDISESIVDKINDYKYIYILKNPYKHLTPDDVRNMFQENKTYIIKELESSNIDTILLTHHGVNELCNGKYRGNFMQSGYTTNITELIQFKHLLVCINGHTHSSVNTFIPDTSIKLLSNCYGYKGENQYIVKYNPDAFIEI